MFTVKVNKPGYLIRVNSKSIRSPFTIYTDNVDEIECQIKQKGISDYSIIQQRLRSSQLFKLGCIQDRLDNRDYQINSIQSSSKLNLPQVVDYTNQMSSVKDQGRLGSCVGFAIASMKEYQEQKEYLQEIEDGSLYRRKESEYDLSEMWIYYKAKEIDPWPNQEGTSIRDALKQLCKYGVPPEKGWRYNDRIKTKHESWAPMISKWGKGNNYFRINGVEELKSALYNYGPIVVGILCFREIFQVGSNGIVKYPSNPNQCYGGHAICITAYNQSSQLFKFKNSWSSNWGNRGYGYLSFKYVQNFMMDAWVLIDKKVLRSELGE